MVYLTFVKSKNEENKEQIWYQILSISLVSASFISDGALYAWTSPAIPELTSPNYPVDITLDEASYLTVIPQVVSVFLIPLTSALLNKIGRKTVLLLSNIPKFVSWIIIANADSIYLFYLSRVFTGLSNACIMTGMYAYVGEVTTPKVRGLWGNAPSICLVFGYLLVNAVGGYCNIKTTAYAFSVVTVIFAFLFGFMPETPYYLLMKGREEEAKVSLQKLRCKNDVEEERRQIKENVIVNKSTVTNFQRLFSDYKNRKALKIIVFSRIAVMLSGEPVFDVYSQHFFQEAKLSPALSSVILTSVDLVLMIISSTYLDRLGRRLTMISSGAGCTLVLGLISIYFYLKTMIDFIGFEQLPLIGMICFMSFYYLGLGLTPYLLSSELFATEIKSEALTFAAISETIFAALVNKLFPFLSEYSLWLPFLFFGVCTAAGTILSALWIPETKGKSLEDIQVLLGTN